MNYKEESKKWLEEKMLLENYKEDIKNYDDAKLKDAFYKNLEFGTGGMRGVIGTGTNRMNIYTIRKVNYGFAKYLTDKFSHIKDKKNVIAYDCRNFSKQFAMESAKVMATFGIKTYMFKQITPTPVLSYAVKYLNAIGGIVITASHNPPEYNGYKIYDEEGCQLVPHLADRVIEEVSKVENLFEVEVLEESEMLEKDLLEYIDETLTNDYVADILKLQYGIENQNKNNKIKIVYTPLHGTGNFLLSKVFKKALYDFEVVEEQKIEDPYFSTVKSPNPEDHSAFEYAIKIGEQIDADLLIANDPDADRVGLAVKHDKKYHFLDGNQVGALLIYYILNRLKSLDKIPENGMIFNTIVTSNLGATIAKSFGIEVKSTLTGFKFIGEQIAKHMDKKFVFGYEESIGYLFTDKIRDKDGIGSALMCAEMTQYYKNENKTLVDVLNDIYKQYGYHKDSLIQIVLKGEQGQKQIAQTLNNLRTNPPTTIAGLKIVRKEDYLIGEATEDNKIEKLNFPVSNVLKYILEDTSQISIRPSGTEPKMKVYYSIVANTDNEAIAKLNTIKDSFEKIIK